MEGRLFPVFHTAGRCKGSEVTSKSELYEGVMTLPLMDLIPTLTSMVIDAIRNTWVISHYSQMIGMMVGH